MGEMAVLPVVGSASTAAVIGLIGFSALRAEVRALGFWLLGWAVFLASVSISLIGAEISSIRPVAFLFCSLVTPLMVMGAYAHTERSIPAWVFPAGFLLGVSRLMVYVLGSPEIAPWISGTFEPLFALMAAETIRRYAKRPSDRLALSDQSLIVGFVALSAVELFASASQILNLPPAYLWGVWAFVGLPLVSLQGSLYVDRLGRRAEESSRQSEAYSQRLKILTESAGDIMVESDDQGTITYISPNMSKLTGDGLGLLIGRNVLEFVGPLKTSAITRSLALNGRITEQSVIEDLPRTVSITLPDGSQPWIEATGATYRTASGELRILAFARDVTARIVKDEATKQSELRLNRAERIANFGSWEYFPLEDRLVWSDQMFRLYGLPDRGIEIDIARMRSLTDPADLEILTASFQSSPTDDDIVYRIRRADTGEVRSLRTRGEIGTDENGKIIRITGVSIDVTEQLAIEDKLLQGEHHLRVLVESNIVGVFYSDTNGFVTEANEAFLSSLGYTNEDLPLVWKEITPKDSHGSDETADREFEQTGIILPYEKDFLTSSGERVSLLIGCARTGPNKAMFIAVDLSERKRAEAYITRYQNELEETIAERTHQLIESRNRLIESERLAAVGTLAAGVAHQINNPIGAILNSAEYALLCHQDENATRVFEDALRANLSEAQRCAQIVKSMLLFSRDEPTAKWVGDLNSVARRAHRAITPYAADRGATVIVRTPSASIFAQISPIEVEQAIVNILRNAIESHDKGASVSISLMRSGNNAEIEVLDDGRGVEGEHRDHLFEPFYTTRTRDGGSGLGLSVAHGIITDHGGEIEIDSILGEGTRVVITLPIVEPDTP